MFKILFILGLEKGFIPLHFKKQLNQGIIYMPQNSLLK